MATNADKYPDLWKSYQGLLEEKRAIQEKSKPVREKRDALLAQIQPLEKQARELDKLVAEVEGKRLFQLDNQISALARAMGGKRMSDGKLETPAEE